MTVKRNPRRRRRRNPMALRRRRRNPVAARSLFSGVVPMVKNAVVGAVGSIGVDYAWAQVNASLPAAIRTVPGAVGAGDAVKVLATVALGRGLSRITRGMSVRMAEGALTVQAERAIRGMLPVSITSQLGYAGPAMTAAGSNRIGPNTMRAYTRPVNAGGSTPLLSAYTTGNALLSRGMSARTRETIRR
jgi:hypothetical protein